MKRKEKLIGRREEEKILEDFFDSSKAEFLAIYGRRRIGKTYLIRSFFKNKTNIFFNSTGIHNGKLDRQIKEFTKELSRTFLHGIELKEKDNWFDTFEVLTELINKQGNKKVVLFFDEFPWMATARSKILEAIDYYWNHFWSQDARIKLIICGSAASWIIKNIVNDKGGLHNRITRTILLEPMNLRDTKQLLLNLGVKLNNAHVAQIYMMTGGVPFYLANIPSGLSATQVIEKLAFSKNGLLLEEFDRLYSSLFDDAEIYIEIVKEIAKNRYGLSQRDLAQKIKKISRGGTLVKKLKDLENAGFIISFIPYKHKKRGMFYKLIDEYSLFYLYWIEPIKASLQKQSLREGYWEKLTKSSSWYSWAGYTFEAMCYKHLKEISQTLDLSPTAIQNTWQYIPHKGSKEDGAQIDLLFDRDDDAITICEIKYTSSPFAIDKEYAAKLRRKIEIFRQKTQTSKQIFLSMISAQGLKSTIYSEDMVDKIVTLNDFFQ